MREDIKASIDRYAKEGCPTDDFLKAVLENKLTESFAKADDDNIKDMFEIVNYCYWNIPSISWGSPQAVKDWINMNEARRKKKSESEFRNNFI